MHLINSTFNAKHFAFSPSLPSPTSSFFWYNPIFLFKIKCVFKQTTRKKTKLYNLYTHAHTLARVRHQRNKFIYQVFLFSFPPLNTYISLVNSGARKNCKNPKNKTADFAKSITACCIFVRIQNKYKKKNVNK